MVTWDYRIIGIAEPETQSGVAELMARQGQEGWELVTIDFNHRWAYFKRPIERTLREDFLLMREMFSQGANDAV